MTQVVLRLSDSNSSYFVESNPADNLQAAKVFASAAGAKNSNAYRHWGYTTIVPVQLVVSD